MKCKRYNLIEIALSIAILALGLTAIVSLFPLGFQEIGDSIGETYSSMAADSMIAYVAREAYRDWDIIEDNDNVPTSKPNITDTGILDPGAWEDAAEGDIYVITDENATPSTTNGIYGLMLTSGDDNSITDFTGEALLWKSKIQDVRAAGETIDLEYNEAAALHLEISWPVEKPYAQRKKNTFYFELFNYNQ
jgi:hypothetical protein